MLLNASPRLTDSALFSIGYVTSFAENKFSVIRFSWQIVFRISRRVGELAFHGRTDSFAFENRSFAVRNFSQNEERIVEYSSTSSLRAFHNCSGMLNDIG